LAQSWEDEQTNNGNSKSGTLPDLVEGDSGGKFTQYSYCTYGLSFRHTNFLSSMLFFNLICLQ